MRIYVYTALECILCLVFLKWSTTANIYHESEINLHQKLLQNYNRNVRPTQNIENATTTSVLVAYYLISLQDFNDKTGLISTSGVFSFYWMDFDLRWNTSEYNEIEHIYIQKKTIWTPTITLINPYYELQEVGNERQDELVRVTCDGGVTYTPGSVLDAVCSADVTYFPFDTQVCQFNLTAWYYNENELQFYLSNDGENIGLSENNMWYIEYVKFEMVGDYLIIMSVKIKRKPLFYLYNIILPINFICLLNIFVFLLPSDSGEKIGFSVTMLLSLAVFLTIVSDRLPESSNPSILGFFLLLQFCMSGLILVLSIFSLRFYHRDKTKPVPVTIQRIIKCCSVRSKRETIIIDNHVTWITVSMLFDIVCFFLFVLIYFGLMLCYIIIFYKLV